MPRKTAHTGLHEQPRVGGEPGMDRARLARVLQEREVCPFQLHTHHLAFAFLRYCGLSLWWATNHVTVANLR
jgi:hypothetical protein